MPARDPLGRKRLPYFVNFNDNEVQLYNRNYQPLGEPVKLTQKPDFEQMKSVAWSDSGLLGPMDGGYQELHNIWTAYLYDGDLLEDADWLGYFHRLRVLWQWKSV